MDDRVLRFKEAAHDRWVYLEDGNSKKGNKCYEELLTIAQELQNEGKLHELEVLLDESDDGVIFEAASKLLTINIKKAVEAMNSVASKKGILPFSAKQTLKQWKEGNLKF